MELPEGFVERMLDLVGDELPAFLAALRDPSAGLRVNTLRLAPEAFAAVAPFALNPLPSLAEGFLLASGSAAGRHPYHAAGLYYLQDPGAMLVGAWVGARPGERVLDLSAAPGGKSTHLAARMENRGLLVANDVSRPRAIELVGNLERCGVRNAIVTSETPERLAAHFGGYFDRVLVDAPCSGESMFHRSAAARADWSTAVVAGCARRQEEILRTAADCLRPGGLIVYSTCTFNREENESVVESLLRERPDFRPAALPAVPGAEPVRIGDGSRAGGGSTHAPRSEASTSDASAAAGYRLWPHRVPGAGHTLFALGRLGAHPLAAAAPADGGAAAGGDRPAVHAPEWTGLAAPDRGRTGRGSRQSTGGRAASRPPPRRSATRTPPQDAVRMVEEFIAATYTVGVSSSARIDLIGDRLFALPAEAPPLEGLRVLRPGLLLGTVYTGRFEPAHALALAIDPGAAVAAVALELADRRLDRYLRGHPIDSPGPAGWAPVTVDGFALGWGKRVGSTVKNHYPKGLRLPP